MLPICDDCDRLVARIKLFPLSSKLANKKVVTKREDSAQCQICNPVAIVDAIKSKMQRHQQERMFKIVKVLLK